MVRMVKVFERNGHETGYFAEVPGQQGRYVLAQDLTELRSKIQAILAERDGSSFASSSWSMPSGGYSDTALFLAL
jgi:hypothetical protein